MVKKNQGNLIDVQEVLKRAIKYLIEGLAVALAARYLPSYKIELKDIALIAFTAASTFAVLDMYAPTIGNAARRGTGFTIGSSIATGILTGK
tara:strand:+ start:396 stop:671 length:276 start_codon:yes stop_codon:yes gene_type:complete